MATERNLCIILPEIRIFSSQTTRQTDKPRRYFYIKFREINTINRSHLCAFFKLKNLFYIHFWQTFVRLIKIIGNLNNTLLITQNYLVVICMFLITDHSRIVPSIQT